MYFSFLIFAYIIFFVVPLQHEHSASLNLDWGVPGWKGLSVLAILFYAAYNLSFIVVICSEFICVKAKRRWPASFSEAPIR